MPSMLLLLSRVICLGKSSPPSCKLLLSPNIHNNIINISGSEKKVSCVVKISQYFNYSSYRENFATRSSYNNHIYNKDEDLERIRRAPYNNPSKNEKFYSEYNKNAPSFENNRFDRVSSSSRLSRSGQYSSRSDQNSSQRSLYEEEDNKKPRTLLSSLSPNAAQHKYPDKPFNDPYYKDDIDGPEPFMRAGSRGIVKKRKTFSGSNNGSDNDFDKYDDDDDDDYGDIDGDDEFEDADDDETLPLSENEEEEGREKPKHKLPAYKLIHYNSNPARIPRHEITPQLIKRNQFAEKAMSGMRFLYDNLPEVYTVDTLSRKYKLHPCLVRRVLDEKIHPQEIIDVWAKIRYVYDGALLKKKIWRQYFGNLPQSIAENYPPEKEENVHGEESNADGEKSKKNSGVSSSKNSPGRKEMNAKGRAKTITPKAEIIKHPRDLYQSRLKKLREKLKKEGHLNTNIQLNKRQLLLRSVYSRDVPPPDPIKSPEEEEAEQKAVEKSPPPRSYIPDWRSRAEVPGWKQNKLANLEKRNFNPWAPTRKVSREMMEKIRWLHKELPNDFTVPKLAEDHQIPQEAVLRILKSKFVPTPEVMERYKRRKLEKAAAAQKKARDQRRIQRMQRITGNS
ncbi:13301_t:CDS:2 [Ambispora gerdemannii]|uniref:Required for respiratory growth protein 9, mitochondrial n=1 Tax=Ambispora gerdemannii TaxID=144530 RepID=A0A9N8W9Y2_9GLOM|nr:13301_t:CDS:2 [Ambispora gerdemannii]